MEILKKAPRLATILVGIWLFVLYEKWTEQTWPNNTPSETVFRELYLKLLVLVPMVAVYETVFAQPRLRAREIAHKVLGTFVYVSVASLGCWLMARFYETVLASQSLPVQVSVVILLGIPLFFAFLFLALWVGNRSSLYGPTKRTASRTRKRAIPLEKLATLENEFILRPANRWQKWLTIPFAVVAIGGFIGCLGFWNSAPKSALGAAIVGAVGVLGTVLFATAARAVHCNAHAISQGQQRFLWGEIERIEETHAANPFGENEICLWEFKTAEKAHLTLNRHDYEEEDWAKFEQLFEEEK